ncbi:prepilin peptidase [Sulfurimonas sediminis]|uniref:Prepilin peptidase n=1 Tax=Sulfurimonas sediminis TaxID=2590020 RepID=A0A7M1B3T6_9BACT|nr:MULTISPECIES: A24 family peptidase [Sulfurimonas]QOP44340.1 prepilin peptidase [Sulfurimonas sediminis]UCM99929.1 A24 family peptidase [Sulfurimonas sp. SWIR-19]
MIIFVYFIIIASVLSYIDSKKRVIPDRIILPAFAVLVILKWWDADLSVYDLYAVLIVLVIFIIPVILNMAFGGGDLRFGAFCALFVGLPQVGYFIIFSGLIHLVILAALKKKSYGFAPAMSIAAILSYTIGKL